MSRRSGSARRVIRAYPSQRAGGGDLTESGAICGIQRERDKEGGGRKGHRAGERREIGDGIGGGKGRLGRKLSADMTKKRMLCSSKHVSCLCRVGMSPKPYGGRSPWRSPGPISVASAQRPPFKRPDAILCFSPPPSPSDIRSSPLRLLTRCAQRVCRSGTRFLDPHS